MPLVAHSTLPAFAVVRDEGLPVVAGDDVDPTLPTLRIGMLNLMPDAALQATERQFLRLTGAYADAANLYVLPFAVRAADSHRAARDFEQGTQ